MNYHPLNVGSRALRDFVTIAESVLEEEGKRKRGRGTDSHLGWAPRSNLREDDKFYFLSLDLPGVPKDAIDIAFHEGVLTVSGERRSGSGEESARTLIEERPEGKFVRTVKINDEINANAITASCAEGVLSITIPKAECAKAVKVKID